MAKKYDFKKIEQKWQKYWARKKTFVARDDSSKPKYYALIEFPYPSGEGLHVGHPRPFTGLDVVARKKRMEGYEVLYPIGWDAFGLPTENYAIKTGMPPAVVTKKNTDNFRRQAQSIGFSFDWSREVNTTDPAYYKWTQWIFLQFFKHGLAYKKKMAINWCPSCKIGLANEEVVDGACERCGGSVTQREKEQWMLAITKYAQRLIDDLEGLDYIEPVKAQQRNWIGRSDGVNYNQRIKDLGFEFKVYDSVPQSFCAQTFAVIAPEHPLVPQLVRGTEHEKSVMDFIAKIKQKKADKKFEVDKDIEGIFTGRYIENPFGTGDLPLWVASFAVYEYGSGMVNCSAHDERDFAFAKKYGIPLKPVMFPTDPVEAEKVRNLEYCYHHDPEAILTQPEQFKGRKWGEARADIIEYLGKRGWAYPAVQYKLRDWVFSRQRYWGEPIPLVHCDACEAQEQKEDVFMFHGWDGSSKGDFFPSLKQNLTERGYRVYIDDAPNTREPKFDEWFKFAKKSLKNKGKGRPNVLGHSMGGLLALKVAEKYKVNKLILVAPVGFQMNDDYFNQFLPELAEREMNIFKAYMNQTLDVEAVKKNAKQIIFLFSEDDPWITRDVREKYQTAFGASATFKMVNGYGHFSWGEGYTQLPLVEMMFETKQRDGWIPVSEKKLPLTLPEVEKYQPTDTGESPLAAMKDWVTTTCPRCDGPARRETDTMPNWAGSSWYFMRYLDPKNKKALASPEKLKHWLPVDWYNGGMEHTTLHLLYSRFWHKFLWDIGAIPAEVGSEPYKKRTSHGLILAKGGEKMSKSKGNVVNPDEIIASYGADAFRTYEMFMGPFDQAAEWDTNGLEGVRRFLERVWGLQSKVKEGADGLETVLHKTTKKVTEDIDAMRFNTAVASLMECSHEFLKADHIAPATFATFVQLLSPFSPHISEELWKHLGHEESIVLSTWPTYNPELIKENQFELVVQVNGKIRDQFIAPVAISEQEAIVQALARPKIQKWLDGKSPKKVIYVKEKLVSIVV